MKYQITIPKPCHENWNEMTTTEKGKFCGKCSKVVADLTTLTDRQLIDTLHNEKNMCGRLTKTQLEKPIEILSQKTTISKAAIGLAFTALVASSEVSIAQTNTTKTEKVVVKQGEIQVKKSTPQKTITIKGNVSDAYSVLPGASIVLKGTLYKTETDFDGNFSLKIPNKKLKSTILVVSYLGYKTVEVDVLSIKKPLRIVLKESGEFLGKVTVTAGMVNVKKPNLFQRIDTIFKKKENRK